VVHTLRRLGPRLDPLAARITMGPVGNFVLQRSGLMFPGADRDTLRRAVTTYLDTPVEWGMHLALHADEHARVSLSGITVPTTFVAGKYDLLASARDMRSAAGRIPGAEFVELVGSHFIQMERPHDVHAHLLALLDRVETS
jgi:pimeloyl-ACP methyl ester carboxylesterase